MCISNYSYLLAFPNMNQLFDWNPKWITLPANLSQLKLHYLSRLPVPDAGVSISCLCPWPKVSLSLLHPTQLAHLPEPRFGPLMTTADWINSNTSRIKPNHSNFLQQHSIKFNARNWKLLHFCCCLQLFFQFR